MIDKSVDDFNTLVSTSCFIYSLEHCTKWIQSTEL